MCPSEKMKTISAFSVSSMQSADPAFSLKVVDLHDEVLIGLWWGLFFFVFFFFETQRISYVEKLFCLLLSGMHLFERCKLLGFVVNLKSSFCCMLFNGLFGWRIIFGLRCNHLDYNNFGVLISNLNCGCTGQVCGHLGGCAWDNWYRFLFGGRKGSFTSCLKLFIGSCQIHGNDVSVLFNFCQMPLNYFELTHFHC